jgi:hypothetical protein
MKKAIMALATAATVGFTALATTSPAEARWGGGWGAGHRGRTNCRRGDRWPGIVGIRLGPGYGYYGYGPGYGYAPAYYGGYAYSDYNPYPWGGYTTTYYNGYAPGYYGYCYRRVVRPAYAYYAGSYPRRHFYRHRHW